MAAFRAIRTNVNESTKLAKLSHGAERLYWRMVATSDRWGRQPGSSNKIKARCMGNLHGEEDHCLATIVDIREWIKQLQDVGLIVRHRNGEDWIELVNFDDNQPKGNRKNRGAPEFGPLVSDSPRQSETVRDCLGLEVEVEVEVDIEKNSRAKHRKGPSADRKRSQALDPTDPIAVLVSELKNADEGTETVLRELALPEAAYRSAIEALRDLRKKGKGAYPRNDAGWIVARLNAQIIEGVYRKGSA